MTRFASSLAIAIALAAPAQAEPTLGPLFSDHAVLQRDRPISIWGKADPGEAVSVTLGEAKASARADGSGNWRVELPAMKAGGPYRLAVTGADVSAAAEDILIGDVWLGGSGGPVFADTAAASSLDGERLLMLESVFRGGGSGCWLAR